LSGSPIVTTITPPRTIIITDRRAAEKTLKAIELAHRDCLVANSLRTIVTVIQLSIIE
jgi:organic hydroperoxide reductase OsmC/OhrA